MGRSSLSTLANRIGAVLHPNREWVWLAYLPFYAFPWFYQLPSGWKLAGSAIGIAAFLAIYVATACRMIPLRRGVVAIFILSLLLAPLGGNWSVIAVFAAALAGNIQPARDAVRFVGVFALATAAVGVGLSMPWLWWLPGAVLIVMVGMSNIAGKALTAKNEALLAAQEEVRTLGGIAERERIARDLHDVMGRTLTLIALKADLVAKLAERDPAEAAAEARTIAAAAREGLADVRGTLADTRRAVLSREIDHARELLATAGIACSIEGEHHALASDRQGVLAMAMREAVTNVARHSNASHCRILILSDGGQALLIVEDDGDGAPLTEGSGLRGMRARLAAAGGALEIARSAGWLRLSASVPST